MTTWPGTSIPKSSGVLVDDIEFEAKHARNWTDFSGWLYAAMDGLNG